MQSLLLLSFQKSQLKWCVINTDDGRHLLESPGIFASKAHLVISVECLHITDDVQKPRNANLHLKHETHFGSCASTVMCTGLHCSQSSVK